LLRLLQRNTLSAGYELVRKSRPTCCSPGTLQYCDTGSA